LKAKRKNKMAFNKVILIGNITADPELKQTQSGLSVCNFDLAVNRRFTKQGENTVDFIKISAWRASAEFVSKYVRKGNSLLVCGQLQTRNYTDSQGQKRYVAEVVADEVSFAGNKSDNTSSGEPRVSIPPSASSYTPSAYGASQFAAQPQFEEIPTGDDSLPFD
jgi:single-strand DNA-binding protein